MLKILCGLTFTLKIFHSSTVQEEDPSRPCTLSPLSGFMQLSETDPKLSSCLNMCMGLHDN